MRSSLTRTFFALGRAPLRIFSSIGSATLLLQPILFSGELQVRFLLCLVEQAVGTNRKPLLPRLGACPSSCLTIRPQNRLCSSQKTEFLRIPQDRTHRSTSSLVDTETHLPSTYPPTCSAIGSAIIELHRFSFPGSFSGHPSLCEVSKLYLLPIICNWAASSPAAPPSSPPHVHEVSPRSDQPFPRHRPFFAQVC